MTTQQIANRLVELCRKGEWKTAQQELFSKDAVSIEPHETPGFPKETRGLDEIVKKGERFEDMLEQTHSLKASEPLIAGNAFSVAMDMDMTMKGQGRMKMAELCVYETKDGKIISEQFFM
jgi:hypothetical protein